MKNLYFVTDYKDNSYWKRLNCLTSNHKYFMIDIPYDDIKSFNKFINGFVEFVENLTNQQIDDILHNFEKFYNSSLFEIALYFDRSKKNNNLEFFKLDWNSFEEFSKINTVINFNNSNDFIPNYSFENFSNKVMKAEKEINKVLTKSLEELKINLDFESFKVKKKYIDVNIVKDGFTFSIKILELFENLYKKHFHNTENKMFLHKPILFFDLMEVLNKNDEHFFNNVALVLFYDKIEISYR